MIIDLGTSDEPRDLKIGKLLTSEKQKDFTLLLREFRNVFAWSYKAKPGINRDIVECKIPLYLDVKPAKLCRIKLEWALKIK